MKSSKQRSHSHQTSSSSPEMEYFNQYNQFSSQNEFDENQQILQLDQIEVNDESTQSHHSNHSPQMNNLNNFYQNNQFFQMNQMNIINTFDPTHPTHQTVPSINQLTQLIHTNEMNQTKQMNNQNQQQNEMKENSEKQHIKEPQRKCKQDKNQNLASAKNKITKKLYDELCILYIYLALGCDIELRRPKKGSKTTPFLAIQNIMHANIPIFNQTQFFINQSITEKKNDKEEIMARSMRVLVDCLKVLDITYEAKTFTIAKGSTKKRTAPLILKSITIGKVEFDKKTIDDIAQDIKKYLIDPLLADERDHEDSKTLQLDCSHLIDINTLPQNSTLSVFIQHLYSHFHTIRQSMSLDLIIKKMSQTNLPYFMSDEERKCQDLTQERMMRNNNQFPMIPLTTPLFPNASYQPIPFANPNNESNNVHPIEYQYVINYRNSSFQN